jgi:hypothetical protein
MKYFLAALGCIVCLSATGQNDGEVSVYPQADDKSKRSGYIKGYPDYFFIWPVLKQRKFDFEIRDLKRSKDRLPFKSNKPYSFGLGMYLFELGFELAFAVPLDEQSKRIYGESKARDIQLNILGKKWGIDAYAQRYSGFYIDDPEVKVPANEPYPQRPDIRTRNLGVTLNYTFNYNKFSFRSAYNFAERQLSSAGSFVVFGSLDNIKVSADSAIAGKSYETRFGEYAGIDRVNTTVLAIAPGYTYSLIYKGFFLNGTFAIGPANNWVSYTLENGKHEEDLNFTAFIAARLGLGYNGDRFFGGLMFMSLGRSAKFEEVQLTSSNSSFKILVGYRFQEFGILKKRVWDIPKNLF